MLNWNIYKDFKKGLSREKIAQKHNIKEWVLTTLYNIRNNAIPETLVLVLSDLHFGSSEMPDNFEETFLDNLLYILNNIIIYKNIDEIVIFELGDIIDNILHSTQREVNIPIDESIRRAKRFYRELLMVLEPNRFFYVVGNHDRITKDLTTKHYITNEIFSDLKDELEMMGLFDTEIIKLDFPDNSIINIKGWNILLAHGTFYRTLSGEISGLSLKRLVADLLHLTETYNKDGTVNKVELVFMGHIHKLINYRTMGIEVFINGTSHRKGFHKSNARSEDLGQWLITLPPKKFCIKNNKLRPTIGTAIKIWCE